MWNEIFVMKIFVYRNYLISFKRCKVEGVRNVNKLEERKLHGLMNVEEVIWVGSTQRITFINKKNNNILQNRSICVLNYCVWINIIVKWQFMPSWTRYRRISRNFYESNNASLYFFTHRTRARFVKITYDLCENSHYVPSWISFNNHALEWYNHEWLNWHIIELSCCLNIEC